MPVLLTGGTGKTSVRLARFLQNENIPFLLASRRGAAAAPSGMPAVKFDWLDQSTWKEPFQSHFAGGGTITAIYLMEPLVAEPWKPMNEFIDFARTEHGVRRFVLVAGSSAEPSKPGMGMVWQHFLDTGVDYCVLRPSWFMENLSDGAPSTVIRDMDKIFTACGDGKIPFVSAIDIAAVAFRAITDPKSHNCDHRVLGPELLTYDEVAEKLSAALGRRIEHVKLTGDERYESLVGAGVSEYYARFLTNLETAASTGFETRMNATVQEVTGRTPGHWIFLHTRIERLGNTRKRSLHQTEASQRSPCADEEDQLSDWIDVLIGMREITEEEEKVLVFGWPTNEVGAWVLRFRSAAELPKGFGRMSLAMNVEKIQIEDVPQVKELDGYTRFEA
ncbi:hypothetical protein N7457_002286 [Penicillium paradoxum]|uniref:uncharacterized protein n=1 Tax=Penicillium paradoxum TaxID=176176 RepID=UPI002548C889|nr:uncharacterized protein N7457_002286 [Penicillium paradoxum]KAJ5787296.1 hypothetical protein N7457_002286 [Penicillium paradoxum]